jgi:subtilisin-like proprotein convertase family protein
MDAGLMTWYAKSWKNVPTMSTCVSHSNEMFTVDLTECKDSIDRKRQVNYIEQVQVFVTLKTSNRGEIEIYLFSPSNTKTQLLPVRLSESLIRILLICVI